MKTAVQRMIAQRRIALVTERTPLQPGNVSEEPKPWPYVGCDFAGPDGGGQYTCFMSQMERVIFAVFSRVQADTTPPRVPTQYEKLVANLERVPPRPQWLTGEWT